MHLALAAPTLAIAALLLFVRLGHYPLWDDEALVGLAAKGILATGDTTAVVGHNLVAYRGGLLLHDLKDRGLPPLGPYLAALSFALFGDNAAAARLPFALAGLGTVGLLLFLAVRAAAPAGAFAVLCAAILGNVSFFLYARQCRYYALAMGLSVLVVALYLAWNGRRARLIAAAIAAATLFAANSLDCAALLACLAVDYAVWGRKERPPRMADALAFVLPFASLCLPVAFVWNPFSTGFGSYAAQNSVWDRVTLWLWHWRDLNQCEFFSGTVLAACVYVALARRDRWLGRGLLALATYVSFVAFTSPQTVFNTSVADVRYVTPVIPLAMALATRAIWLATGRRAALALPIAFIAFGSNLPNGGLLLGHGVRVTWAAFVGELADPPQDPYTVAIDWVRGNVPAGASVWVLPDYMAYPLMFHAPDPVYAWQIEEATGQFAGVDEIHVRGRKPPRYIVVFGPIIEELSPMLEQWRTQGARYEPVAELDVFWRDLYRPELFWRTFRTIRPGDPKRDGIHVLRLARSGG